MSVNLQLGGAQVKLEGTQARVYAGRDPQACQLAHLDPTLSRRHAEIFLDQSGQCFIRDLGSANGTWIDGRSVGHETIALRPGMQVWLGHVPLGITWMQNNQNMGQTVMAAQVPEQLKALIAQRQQQMAAMQAAPPPAASGGMAAMSGGMAAMSGHIPVAAGSNPAMPQMAPPPSSTQPLPKDFAYRRQGSNDNGTLLIALKQDTFFNGQELDGFIEFTSTDRQTVASITIELVEHYKGGPYHGHVWDRFMVRQGPWRAENGDVLPLPFKLRIPPGTSMSSRTCHWELRSQVDINWATDIDASIPVTMRNQDIERLRDGLGALDFRVEDIEATALGQTYEGVFAPPAHLARNMGINDVRLTIDYLGANLKVRMRVDKKGLKHDRALDQIFELPRLRAASQADINATLKSMLDQLMAQ